MFGKAKSEIVLKIEGMHCMMCSSRVEKALKALDGVKKVAVNLEAKTAKLVFDADKVGAAEMCAAVEALGFHASV